MHGWDDKDELEATPVGDVRNAARPVGDGDTLVIPMETTGPAGGDAHFDYSAFEESLDELALEEGKQAPAPPPPAPAPRERRPVPKRARPDDATHSVRPAGKYTHVLIQGRINESFDGEQLGQQIRGQAVIFDLAEVDRITSFGVRGWLKMMQVAGLSEAYFFRCSESVINQITMIHNFCGAARVHSLVAPYLCASCGAEFGIVLEADGDGDAIRGRRPPEVVCPECSATAEMDEDPWAFFDLDQQLLDTVPEELAKALDLLSAEPRHAPVEKFVSGGTTRIAFNGEITEKTRFHRPLSGIEGVVVIDLVHAESATEEGYRRLLDALQQARAEVTQFRFEGVTPDLGRILLEVRPEAVAIASLRFPATNANGIRRSVMVDCVANRGSLIQQRPPRVDAAWAQASITLDDAELAAQLVDIMGYVPTDPPRGATPAPAPSQGTPAPAPRADAAALPPGGAYPATPYTATPAPVMLAYPPQAPAPAAGTRLVLAAALAIALVTLLVVVITVGLVATSAINARPVAQAPVAAAPAAVAPVVAAPPDTEGAWSTGDVERPSWAASPVMATETHLLVLGEGQGPSATAARDRATQAGLYHLAQYVRQQIATSPAAAGLDNYPMPDDQAVVATTMRGGWTPLPAIAENQTASRTLDGQEEFLVQFAIEKAALQAYVDVFTALTDFRGLKVAEAPPWSPRQVRLVESPTWWPVPAGAKAVEVAGSPALTVGSFVSQGESAYNALEPGSDFQITFASASGKHPVTVSKRGTAAKPKLELMKMEGR